MAVCIIAEAGVNHNGSLEIAKKMVLEAKNAGADYVKFQTFIPELLVSKFAQKASYQKENTGNSESQLQMLKKLALSEQEFIELRQYCEKTEIGFLSTPFDLESIEILQKMNMDFWKLPSGEITNLPYLEEIGKTKKPVVLSTGMAEIDEVAAAIEVLKKSGTTEISILHCNTQYPTPFQDVNLLAMEQLRKSFQVVVGYSDHTKGIEVPIAAVALGAQIIEKHFTLDCAMTGPDHKASLEPTELKSMVEAIRNIEQALGDGHKKRTESEKENCKVARKSIVAKCPIRKGEVFSKENLTVKRPGDGISPMKWYDVIGKTAAFDFETDELIKL